MSEAEYEEARRQAERRLAARRSRIQSMTEEEWKRHTDRSLHEVTPERTPLPTARGRR